MCAPSGIARRKAIISLTCAFYTNVHVSSSQSLAQKRHPDSFSQTRSRASSQSNPKTLACARAAPRSTFTPRRRHPERRESRRIVHKQRSSSFARDARVESSVKPSARDPLRHHPRRPRRRPSIRPSIDPSPRRRRDRTTERVRRSAQKELKIFQRTVKPWYLNPATRSVSSAVASVFNFSKSRFFFSLVAALTICNAPRDVAAERCWFARAPMVFGAIAFLCVSAFIVVRACVFARRRVSPGGARRPPLERERVTSAHRPRGCSFIK